MNSRTTEMQVRASVDRITLPIERRYPLDLMSQRDDVYGRYLESNAQMWDVEGDVRWDALDATRYDASATDAASTVWSWQAWVAFRDITTCEAALVRSCLERDVSADLKFCISTRASERAAAADASAEFAGRIGSYRDRPVSEALEALFDVGMVRRVLHEGVDLDALIVAHMATVPTIDLAVAEARLLTATDDTAGDILIHVVTDLRRQHEWAWTYLGGLGERRDADALQAISTNLAEVLELDLLSGARWTALIDSGIDGAEALMAGENEAAQAGLGGVTAADQRDAVRTAFGQVLARLDEIGVPTVAVSTVLSDRDLQPR